MYFVDRNQIEKALCHIERLLALYQKEENWHEDLIHSLALARLSHDIIEGIIDVGNTMIDGFIMRDPGSYEDIIDIMDDEKVITADMTDPIKKVVALRQMIVREFIDVDTKTIISTLDESYEAIRLFPEKVRHYLEHELGPVSAFLPADDEL
ncbi:DUF86 domain-containing protein [Sporosarcina ureilytica]|uniref:DUF86 domain-containing protein n=1 Tax=Sporosarcina ureilytica TaxID=298596 RepID=A0A1D8JE43_9BACL|nr:DUF86 domain-containing protein [Sporosarcina ureilytica]AOV06980.1 hypothetical protein BI350_04945 [Sporosarcina ureilytica]